MRKHRRCLNPVSPEHRWTLLNRLEGTTPIAKRSTKGDYHSLERSIEEPPSLIPYQTWLWEINPNESNERKERSPPVPDGPSGSNPSSGDIIQREPTGKRGKGKTSSPKKKSSSVKEPSQSSILQKETLPVAPKVLQRSKSILGPIGNYDLLKKTCKWFFSKS